ncbi:MAG: prolipoprotein diacylglyceryl transferase [Candidatus Peribacteraceae bacterium]
MLDLFPSREVLLSIGPLSVHWYGVMYAIAFLLGLFLLRRLLPYRSLLLSKQQIDKLFVWIVLGVVLGGRLGFVLFYGDASYLSEPLRILAAWEGGMSSHGGFIGVTIALLLFCRRNKVSLLSLTDVLVVPIALGLMLGRIGNLINGELFGTVTSVPWAMSFPHAEGLRHPTQIYATLKDLFIALVCFGHLRMTAKTEKPGGTTATFLLLYGLLRFCLEYFREQSYAGTELAGVILSRGQLLTLPILLLGVAVFLWSRRKA